MSTIKFDASMSMYDKMNTNTNRIFSIGHISRDDPYNTKVEILSFFKRVLWSTKYRFPDVRNWNSFIIFRNWHVWQSAVVPQQINRWFRCHENIMFIRCYQAEAGGTCEKRKAHTRRNQPSFHRQHVSGFTFYFYPSY